MCKLQSYSNQKRQADEDGSFNLSYSDDDIDQQFDVWLWCLIIMCERSYHATHMCMLQTCGNQKTQEDDSFELSDIGDDIDEQFYGWLWSLCLDAATMLAATILSFNIGIGDYLCGLATMAFHFNNIICV